MSSCGTTTGVVPCGSVSRVLKNRVLPVMAGAAIVVGGLNVASYAAPATTCWQQQLGVADRDLKTLGRLS